MYDLIYIGDKMIFIGFFGFIVVIVIALNIYDSSNLEKIEKYILKENCTEYIYTKGSYKALCENRLVEISNSFIINIEKNKIEYKYTDIESIEKKKKNIIINDKNKISFASIEDTDEFYLELEKNLKK